MQLVCLDEFGGEKAVEPASQETTIIQHIFGGRLQSQVMHPVILKLFDFVLVCENCFSSACIYCIEFHCHDIIQSLSSFSVISHYR
jgi:hypothetical protein